MKSGLTFHWPPRLASKSLPANEVHVWAAGLDVSPRELTQLATALSAAEQERAARFRFERHRNRFIAGRGWLRAVLGSYLSAEPGALEFAYSAQGKPALGADFAGTGLSFNLAHCQDLALLAVTRLSQVGVDVEQVRPLADAEDLVSRFFSQRESSLFRKLSEAQKPAAFFNLWTRKEAWLKATGEGIAQSLHLVEVSFLPGDQARLLHLPEGLGGQKAWSLHELVPALGFAGALAVGAETPVVRCWSSRLGDWVNQGV